MNIDDLTIEEKSKISEDLMWQLAGSNDEDQKYGVMVQYDYYKTTGIDPSEPTATTRMETKEASRASREFISDENRNMKMNGMTVAVIAGPTIQAYLFADSIFADLSQDYICRLVQRDVVLQILDKELAHKVF